MDELLTRLAKVAGHVLGVGDFAKNMKEQSMADYLTIMEAIAVIMKDDPVKPKPHYIGNYKPDEGLFTCGYECGACGHTIGTYRYCSHCGRKVDWTDEQQ